MPVTELSFEMDFRTRSFGLSVTDGCEFAALPGPAAPVADWRMDVFVNVLLNESDADKIFHFEQATRN